MRGWNVEQRKLGRAPKKARSRAHCSCRASTLIGCGGQTRSDCKPDALLQDACSLGLPWLHISHFHVKQLHVKQLSKWWNYPSAR